jgi:hypothetical protein
MFPSWDSARMAMSCSERWTFFQRWNTDGDREVWGKARLNHGIFRRNVYIPWNLVFTQQNFGIYRRFSQSIQRVVNNFYIMYSHVTIIQYMARTPKIYIMFLNHSSHYMDIWNVDWLTLSTAPVSALLPPSIGPFGWRMLAAYVGLRAL